MGLTSGALAVWSHRREVLASDSLPLEFASTKTSSNSRLGSRVGSLARGPVSCHKRRHRPLFFFGEMNAVRIKENRCSGALVFAITLGCCAALCGEAKSDDVPPAKPAIAKQTTQMAAVSAGLPSALQGF